MSIFKFTLSLLCFFFLLLPETIAQSDTDHYTQQIEQNVHRLVNNYRKRRGLRSLQIKRELNKIAMKHSRDMAAGRVDFSHNGFQDRVAAVRRYAKIPYRVAENLYATTNPDEVAQYAMNGWLNSSGHKKNLDGNYIFTGIAVARSRSGEYFVTQLFVGKKK